MKNAYFLFMTIIALSAYSAAYEYTIINQTPDTLDIAITLKKPGLIKSIFSGWDLNNIASIKPNEQITIRPSDDFCIKQIKIAEKPIKIVEWRPIKLTHSMPENRDLMLFINKKDGSWFAKWVTPSRFNNWLQRNQN